MKRKILLSICLLLTGCIMDYYDHRMVVVNNSQVRIAVEVLNDTTKRTANEIAYYLSNTIAPRDTSFITKAGKNAWPEYAEDGKDKTLYIYFFDADSLSKYQKGGADMNYLLGNRKYLKRLDCSFKELTRTNWKIEYR